MSGYKEFVSKIQVEIEEQITELGLEIETKIMRESFQYFMANGGKRLRPILTLLSAGIISHDYKKAIKAAIAIEILHNFTLVHDDIMDDSPKRRGKDTVYLKYGVANAILLGDIMLSIALKQIEENQNLVRIFNKALYDVCLGQAYDIEYSSQKIVSEDEYLNMIELKTSSLIIGSLLLGASVSGANENSLSQLENIGKNLGIAFQLQDDLLDLISDEHKFGKTKAQDLIEGKKTFIILEAIKLATEEKDRLLLSNFVEKNGIDKTEIHDFISMLERVGAISKTEEKISEYFEKVRESLSNFNDNKFKEYLNSTFEMLIKRGN